jgi:multiple sugar transport system substrate-binding protein
MNRLLLLVLLFTAGCTAITSAGPTNLPPTPPTSTPTPAPTEAVTAAPDGPLTLRVWLPPEFDPDSGSPAGDLLKSRLDEFTSRRPGTRIEVRIKAPDGPGGLLDSLTTASAAAPLALPDLVALPRPIMETAALKGLVHPYQNLSSPIDEPEWYPYARQLARLQDSIFGIPFAGDAMTLVYQPSEISTPPDDLPSALGSPGILGFPAADPQALYTLALYQAAGGNVRDEQGRPILDTKILEQVLTFYQDGSQSLLTPFWLTQFQNDAESWQAYKEGRVPMVVTWMSRFLNELQPDMAASPIPTLSGDDYTLASGWVWSLASPDAQKQKLSTELAEFLSDSEFMARWTAEAGYLPTRTGALTSWKDAGIQALANQILNSAQLYPAEDLLNSLAPALEKATVEVLKQENSPRKAAEDAAHSLTVP